MIIEKSRFKNIMGGLYLKALFFEETGIDKSTVLYTLKQEDHLGYPSLYRLYMEASDATEYSFAITHLHSWSHWETLSECSWFKPYISAWRRELEVKLRAEALNRIKTISASDVPASFQANKYLLDGSWKEHTTSRGKGRPSKSEIRQAAFDIATTKTTTQEDLSRLLGKAN